MASRVAVPLANTQSQPLPSLAVNFPQGETARQEIYCTAQGPLNTGPAFRTTKESGISILASSEAS